MKKLILTALTFTVMATSTAFAANGNRTFNSVYNPLSPSHICKQLGTKVCKLDSCTVIIGGINKPVTTETTTKAQITTKPQIQTTTEKVTETTTRDTTETTTKPQTETTTKREPTTETTTSALNNQSGTYAQQILNLVNAERAKQKLSPLTLNANVSKVAQTKAEDMKNNNYFSHTSPTYGSPFDMLKRFGISYRTAGENIAKGQKTPQSVVSAWMNSPGHRANILNKNYTQLGVGYTGGSSPYWVQMFIG